MKNDYNGNEIKAIFLCVFLIKIIHNVSLLTIEDHQKYKKIYINRKNEILKDQRRETQQARKQKKIIHERNFKKNLPLVNENKILSNLKLHQKYFKVLN